MAQYRTSLRFKNLKIELITVENYAEKLPKSLANQVEMFMPPQGSFDNDTLKRYLEMLKNYEKEDLNANLTLANRLRVAFKDMQPGTICDKFPVADLELKRRLRCVAEYLIRSKEFSKLTDEDGKLVKKKGAHGKLVVVYKPEPKLQESLVKHQLT